MIAILIQLVIALVIVGLILWLVQQFLPVPPVFKSAIYAIVVIILILWLLRVFGLLGTSALHV
jgi:hypothetical protein